MQNKKPILGKDFNIIQGKKFPNIKMPKYKIARLQIYLNTGKHVNLHIVVK
jgi:hypothetical protein